MLFLIQHLLTLLWLKFGEVEDTETTPQDSGHSKYVLQDADLTLWHARHFIFEHAVSQARGSFFL